MPIYISLPGGGRGDLTLNVSAVVGVGILLLRVERRAGERNRVIVVRSQASGRNHRRPNRRGIRLAPMFSPTNKQINAGKNGSPTATAVVKRNICNYNIFERKRRGDSKYTKHEKQGLHVDQWGHADLPSAILHNPKNNRLCNQLS